MEYATLFGLMTVAIAILIWNRLHDFSGKRQLAIHVAAFGIAYFAASASGLLPHAIVLGIVIAVAAILAAIYERRLWTSTLLIPLVILPATILAIVVSQWHNPHPGELVAEKRLKPVVPDNPKPVVPPPAPRPNVPEPVRPQPIVPAPNAEQLLAKPWSTSDEFANWPATRLMARLCKIAYDPSVDAREVFTSWGCESETIGGGSMNGYVIKFGDSVVIVFRGTEASFFDVLQDLYFARFSTNHGDFHAGFNNGYSGMHKQTQKLLAKYNPKRVWITGHSLGGALAIACAYQLMQDDTHPIAGVMTFGQPMVVKQNMANYMAPRLNRKYVHFVNGMDPVPNLVNPYVHFGHLVWLNDGEIYRSKDGMVKGSLPEGRLYGASNKPMPKLKPMSRTQLRQFIHEGQKAEPDFDPTQPMRFKGNWLDYDDHYMDAYEKMADFLIDTPASQAFLEE